MKDRIIKNYNNILLSIQKELKNKGYKVTSDNYFTNEYLHDYLSVHVEIENKAGELIDAKIYIDNGKLEIEIEPYIKEIEDIINNNINTFNFKEKRRIKFGM